ncbi:MAG TPA: 5-oxoprolinase subunit PxpB [Chitinophagaceae bacterium]|nr:5-oxoprolinase subunit PxpB [Chitinophagaceae bacterium]
MLTLPTYQVFPLGDSAITLDFGNLIDEKLNRLVIDLFHSLKEKPIPGMIEAVPAYSSITIYYGIHELTRQAPNAKNISSWVEVQLKERLEMLTKQEQAEGALVEIPVCYDEEFGMDLKEIAKEKNLTTAEIQQKHCSVIYRVYLLGFLPGFPYMGGLDEKLEMPRRKQPRQRLEAGSVGIAGKQTGIYPLASPGGWQIIGRTPLALFNINNKTPTLLSAGDRVRFYPINKHEYKSYQSRTA